MFQLLIELKAELDLRYRVSSQAQSDPDSDPDSDPGWDPEPMFQSSQADLQSLSIEGQINGLRKPIFQTIKS